MPPEFLNSMLRSLFTLEKHVLKVARFPAGVSIIALVRRPGS
jgi:hypothetical protein